VQKACPPIRVRRRWASIWLAIALVWPDDLTGQASPEDELRAALVLGFARFSEWPLTREGPLVISVWGRPGMATALERVAAGKFLNGRPVVIRPVRGPGQAAGSHILYVGRLPGQKLAEALAEARSSGILTLGEEERFLASGGCVYLFEQDGRMSFEVNLTALQAVSVTISSKLLRLGYTSGGVRRTKGMP
jgi:hypothetical protein